MSVVVVIPTRSRPPMLVGRCVAAVRAGGHDGRVIVVDGNDQPLSLTMDVQVLHYPRASVSGARNAALAVLDEEVVCFTDDDCIPAAGWTWAALEALEAAPLVTGRTLGWGEPNAFDDALPFDRGRQPRLYTSADLAPLILVRDILRALRYRRRSYAARATTAFAIGASCNLAAQVDTLRELGGFNEAFGTTASISTGEDTELFLRTLLAGKSILYQPAMVVHHDHSGRDPGTDAARYAVGGAAALALHANIYLWGVLLAKYPETILRREGSWQPVLAAWSRGLRAGRKLRRPDTGALTPARGES